MAKAYIHVRVDSDKKREAEKILNNLSLTLSTGINLCLDGIIRAKGLPFEVKLSRGELLGDKASQMEESFRKTVTDSMARDSAAGHPIALYDVERKRPYLEYPDGRREYDEG